MSREWTSSTLPALDKGTSPELQLARIGCVEALRLAEDAESTAKRARKEAKRHLEHFKALYEAEVTDPLFEVHRD